MTWTSPFYSASHDLQEPLRSVKIYSLHTNDVENSIRLTCDLLEFDQSLMHHVNADRALTDGRRHSLNITRASVSDGKHTGQTGFQHLGRTRERPVLLPCGPALSRSRPVSMNPSSSSARQPRSQSVRGAAPVIKKRYRISRADVSPVFLSRQAIRSKEDSLSRAAISVLKCSSMLGFSIKRSIRYRDMVLDNSLTAPIGEPDEQFATGTQQPAR